MKLGKNAKKAGVLLVIVAIIVVGIFGALASGLFDEPVQAKPSFPIDHLSIDASYLLKTGETNESVNVSCDLFMTNIWEKESGLIKATAYVSESNSNFAVFKSTGEFGAIKANSTMELNIPVKFSDNSYKVEILIFENNKLVKKVTLTVRSYQNYYWAYNGTKIVNVGRTLDDIEKDGQWSISSQSVEVSNVH